MYLARGAGMVTSALLITSNHGQTHAVVALLAQNVRLVIGEPVGPRIPVVAETEGLGGAEALVEELSRLPGVLFVDVVRVDFDPDADVDETPRLGKQRTPANEEATAHGST